MFIKILEGGGMEYFAIFAFLFSIGLSSKMSLVEYNQYKDFTASVSWLIVSMLLTISFTFYLLSFYNPSGVSTIVISKLRTFSSHAVLAAMFVIVMILSVYINRAFFRRKGGDRSSSSHADIS